MTAIGAAVFIDMLEHRERWMVTEINPDLLIEIFKEEMKAAPDMADDSPLQYRSIFNTSKHTAQSVYPVQARKMHG